MVYPWWLSIVRELEQVDHVGGLLLQDVLPADVRDVRQRRPHGVVVRLEALAIEDWVGLR